MVDISIRTDGVVRLNVAGEASFDDIHGEHARFYDEEWDEFLQTDLWLADYRHASFSHLESSHLRDLAQQSEEVAKRRSPLRVAVLVDGPLGVGLGRMWEHFAESTGWTTEVFTDEDAALAWLHGSE